uniref:Uncharacterized protein n=1 Tax=Avena sativa TaxID=4498 RepID=A0ACD5WNY9_AVESA
MKRVIEQLDHLRVDGEEKILPPLEVIIYKDLVPVAWTWDRLLPWTRGSVLFEDYFNYLEEYFRQNVADESAASLDLHAAATNCILAEEQLTTTLQTIASHTAGKVTWDPSLSRKITERARQIIGSDSVSASCSGAIVPAACFLCITEEAKLMSSFAHRIVSADNPTLLQWRFKFSKKVRKAALDILTTYKGPYSRRVAASLLGMKKEASIVFGLLSSTDLDATEKMHVCEEIRPCLLDLLNIILEFFPCESSVNYYPINTDYPAIGSEHEGLHILEPSNKQNTSVDGSFPVNSGNIIGTPITSKSSPGTTPFSCSASSFNDDVSVKDTMPNRKRKSIEQTQGSETPSMQSSEPVNDIAIDDLYDSQITTNNSAATTLLSHYSSSASGEKSSKDIEINKRSIGGTKGKNF